MQLEYTIKLLSIVITSMLLNNSDLTNRKAETWFCVWYIYDDPGIIDPLDDFPHTLADALNQTHYRPATIFEMNQACIGNFKLCAICAQPEEYDFNVPNLSEWQVIHDEILNYYSIPEAYRYPNPSLIREKFFI